VPDTPVTRFCAAGRVVSSFKVRCMRSWRRFCCGWPGLMRSISMPSPRHQPDSRDSSNRALGLAKGKPFERARDVTLGIFENFIAQCRAPDGIFGNAASAAEQGCVPNFGDPPTLG